MSTPYGGNDPRQQPQYGQQPYGQDPGYGQQPGGAYPQSGPQQQPYPPQQYGQQPYGQDPNYGQQPGGYPQQQQPQQPQWGQQPSQYGQQPPSYGQQKPYGDPQQQQQYGGQQPGQYDYGQPGGAAPESSGGSKKGLFIGIGALVVVVAVVAILGFVAPGFFKTQVFNNNQMQTDVAKLLTDTYKIQGVSGVTCPAEQKVEDGAKFECTATINGKPQQVPITVKGNDGNYEVSPPAAK
ncbi:MULTISPECIES: DUF4333 domain-containing protein [unclassified Amycolatopsis]|uniref:DUF4333 domain-containing protein n=1 Tax=unclassified Amycolatopsis TaxID=2618356 RepID=UPI00106EF1A1|nr:MULTISPECIES: DUF4333 domain-containing protein [unclassified Amycolatopsis]